MENSSVLYSKSFQSIIDDLSRRYCFRVKKVDLSQKIPGSFWGGDEAGFIKNTLFFRDSTPLHSIFHEVCHYVCMDGDRRKNLYSDAKSSIIEENGVCYLQILLSNYYSSVGIERMQNDMDRWGYSFRFGSAKNWFEKDASDAFEWLLKHRLIDHSGKPTWSLRKI